MAAVAAGLVPLCARGRARPVVEVEINGGVYQPVRLLVWVLRLGPSPLKLP